MIFDRKSREIVKAVKVGEVGKSQFRAIKVGKKLFK
jgi:hypothetical protein